MNIQDDNLLLEILKWVGIAFAAGFIGYFGRYLGMLIIERMRSKKPQQAAAPETTAQAPSTQGDVLAERKLKLEKKKTKAEAKKAKKAQQK